MILKLGGMEALLQTINTTFDNMVMMNGLWAISNLCKGGLPLEFYKIVTLTLAKIIQRETDLSTLGYAASALFYLSKEESKIQKVIGIGIIPLLVSCLK